MSHMIREVFTSKCPIQITQSLAQAIVRFVNAYETRGTHPEAFNSPFLGLYPCYFLTKDRDDFFALFNLDNDHLTKAMSSHIQRQNVFGVNMRSLTEMMKTFLGSFFQSGNLFGLTAGEVRKIILEITSIDANFKVASDPLNVFITYLLYKVCTSTLNQAQKTETMFKLLMLLQYKFFTSLVNHRFKYKPDEAVMRAMFENLNNKFDIKQHGTWKKVMEARAWQFVTSDSLHYDTFVKYDDDKLILYVITDVQTRIRNQINIVTQEFMKTKENHDKIGSYSHIGTDMDGEKILIDNNSCFDTMTTNVYNDALSVTRFLDDQKIRLTAGLFTGLNQSKIRGFLIAFSELAVKQHKAGQVQDIREIDGRPLLIGSQVLLQHIIQKSYRYCIQNKVNLKNLPAVLKAIKDVYSSSRIGDEGIIQVRESVNLLVEQLQDSRRDATMSSFRIAFILYIILLSFKYLK